MKSDLAAKVFIVAMVSVFGSMALILLVAFASMLLSDLHEAQAVRAVLRGDCAEAIKEASRAGNVPYEVNAYCLPRPR